MKDIILEALSDSIRVKEAFITGHLDRIIQAAEMVATAIVSGHKLLVFGNGGSAADAQHIAAEFINRFRIERQPLAALALTTDTSIITSIANDYHFDEIFEKQLRALGKKGDIALGISTSGNSRNVIRAAAAAKEIGLLTVGLTGPGGKLSEMVDLNFAVESRITARIQEAHIMLGHLLCELVDRILFLEKF
ncbi:MAG: D-sedoheptulose 7-phosphate isomerase [Desulfobacterales bacterium]|nr:D-sedoheptulose 7-phosphate isomerase [Desulfobacterales bacterium]